MSLGGKTYLSFVKSVIYFIQDCDLYFQIEIENLNAALYVIVVSILVNDRSVSCRI